MRNEQSEGFLGMEWASMRNTTMFLVDRLFFSLIIDLVVDLNFIQRKPLSEVWLEIRKLSKNF